MQTCKKTRCLMITTAMLPALAELAVAATNGLVLHLPFENTIEAVAGSEVGAAKIEGKPPFVEGRLGQALSLTDGARLTVPVPPAVKQGEYTIAFWMKPLWHRADNLPHPILEIPDDPSKSDKVGWAPGQYLLSKGWSEAIAPNNLYGATGSTAQNHLRPGQWTHVAIQHSVTGQFTATYFDGEGLRRTSAKPKPAPVAHGNVMHFGRRAGGRGIGDYGLGNFVLDDLKVFARIVEPDELPAIAGAAFPPPVNPMTLNSGCEPARAVATPHVAWAKPLAGGPLKILCVGGTDAAREFIELAQRIEVEPVIVTAPAFDARFAVNPEIGQDIARQLEQHLKDAPDVVLIAGYGWNLLPETTRAALLAFVQAGGGLLLVDPRCVSNGPGPGTYHHHSGTTWYGWADTAAGREIEKLVGRLDRENEAFLTQGIPFAALPEFAGMLGARSTAHFFRGGTVGRGRVLIYDMRFGAFCLTPALPRDTLFDTFTYDYAVGAAARAVLWTAGRAGPARIGQVVYRVHNGIGDRIGVGAAGGWNIDLWNSGTQAVRGVVSLTVRRNGPDAPVTLQKGATLKPGLTQIILKQPMETIGSVFGDVRLLVDSRVADWATGVVNVERGNPCFIAMQADAACYDAGEVPTISGEVAYRKWAVRAGETGEIRWRLYDGHGRLLRRGVEPVMFDAHDEFSTRLAWPVGELPGTSLGYTLVADLARKGKVTDQRSIALWRIAPRDNDFSFFSWGGYDGSCNALAALVMRDRHHMRSGMAGKGRPSDPSFAGQLAWMARNNLQGWIYATTIGVNYHNHAPDDQHGVRRPDLADPAYQEGLRDYLAAAAAAARPYSPMYYSLGDETSVGPPTMAASGHEQAAFRRHLRQRYDDSVKKLNQAWGTTYGSWDDVVIPSSQAMQAGEGGVMMVALQAFRESLYAGTLATGLAGARAADPAARVGIEGIFGHGNAWTGQDYWKLARQGNFLGLYDNSIMGSSAMQYNMVRSFLEPGSLFGCWWNYEMQDPDYSRYGPWHALLHGVNAFGWFTTIGGTYSALYADFSPTEQFGWTHEELEPLLTGVGKLALGLAREAPGVAVLHNQLNLDRNTPRFHAALMMTTLLDDLGQPYDFIHGDQVVAGELLTRPYRVLLLPGQTVMEPEVADAIRRFVARGGAVLADVPPATGNGFRTYEQPLLAQVFVDPATVKGGMPPPAADGLADWTASRMKPHRRGRTLLFNGHSTTYNWDREQPRGEALRGIVRAFLADHGVKPAIAVRAADGSFQPLTVVAYRDGDSRYVGVQREYTVADPSPRHFVFAAPSPAHVYDVRTGAYLGYSNGVSRTLEVARGAMIAFLPYAVQGIAVEGLAPVYRTGDVIRASAALRTGGGVAGQGVFRVEVSGPNQTRLPALCSLPRWQAGSTALELPIAFNDPLGDWTLTVTDVATGVRGAYPFRVE